MEDTYFQASERVRIIEEREHVFVVEDINTKDIHYIDKRTFKAQYEPMFNTEDYIQLKEHIHLLNTQLKQLRRANSKQKNEIRTLRKEREKARKQQPTAQHYKNGKRGTMKNG